MVALVDDGASRNVMDTAYFKEISDSLGALIQGEDLVGAGGNLSNNSLYTFHIDQRQERQTPIGADLFKTCLLLLLMNTLSSECYISLDS